MENMEYKEFTAVELDDDALDTVSGGFTAEEYLEKVGFCAWRATCTN